MLYCAFQEKEDKYQLSAYLDSIFQILGFGLEYVGSHYCDFVTKPYWPCNSWSWRFCSSGRRRWAPPPRVIYFSRSEIDSARFYEVRCFCLLRSYRIAKLPGKIPLDPFHSGRLSCCCSKVSLFYYAKCNFLGQTFQRFCVQIPML